jgi:hypothetical protein
VTDGSGALQEEGARDKLGRNSSMEGATVGGAVVGEAASLVDEEGRREARSCARDGERRAMASGRERKSEEVGGLGRRKKIRRGLRGRRPTAEVGLEDC